MTAFGDTSPEAVLLMRVALQDEHREPVLKEGNREHHSVLSWQLDLQPAELAPEPLEVRRVDAHLARPH